MTFRCCTLYFYLLYLFYILWRREMKTQNEMRSEFEKLEEIKTHLEHGNVFFNEEKQTYASEFSSLHVVACYVNGAWYAFQEQQKKIDTVLNYVSRDGFTPHWVVKEFLK